MKALEKRARERTPGLRRSALIDRANELLAAGQMSLTQQTVSDWVNKGSAAHDFTPLWTLVRVLLEHAGSPPPYDLRQAWWHSQHDLWKKYWEQAREADARDSRGPRPAAGEATSGLPAKAEPSPGVEPNAAGPYRGPAAFGPRDARYFFGRKELTDTLLDRVSAQFGLGGPLLVAGPSGAGKSSLLRAGLVPAADRSSPDGHVILTPGYDPLQALADCFHGDAHPAGVRRRLVEDPSCLRDLLGPGDRRRIVIVDQFEEIFTACADEHERRAFVQALHTACAPAAEAPAVVVIGMRADFFGHCAAYPELLPALQQPLIVGPMTEAQLREAIEGPAGLAGLTLQAGLVEQLLDDLGTTSTGGGGVLPLLSHALLMTWRHREGRELTLAGYRATGGISRSLARTADATLEHLDLPSRQIARRLLSRLVRLGEGTEDTRRRVPLAELLAPEGTPEYGTARQVLDRFVRSRLVTVGESTVEITHEALIRAWPQLRAWIEADRASLLVRQQLDEDAREWIRRDRDPAFLYRGTRLAITQSATEDDRPGLGPEARDFLDAGIRHSRAERDAARRRSRNRTVLSAVLALLLIIAAGTAVTAIAQGRTLNERTLAISRQLDQAVGSHVAGLAVTMRRTDPLTARQLAVAAASLAPGSYEARHALLTLSAQPELYTYHPVPGARSAPCPGRDRRKAAAFRERRHQPVGYLVRRSPGEDSLLSEFG